MTATTTTAHTVAMRPRTLIAVLATTVATSIGATWGAVHVADRDEVEMIAKIEDKVHEIIRDVAHLF